MDADKIIINVSELIDIGDETNIMKGE